MISVNPSDVVLVRFPFTDLSSTKRRPAVVLSPAGYSGLYKDVVIMALTSKEQDKEYCLKYWREAGLAKVTWVKPVIGTVAGSLVDERLGKLHKEDMGRVREAVLATIDDVFLEKQRPSTS